MNDFSCLLNNRSDAVSFMKEQIKHICSKIGKRAPGSSGEKGAAEYMAGVLKECCGCSKVTVESFKEHPSAFWGYFYFSATFDCLCAVCFFILPSLSILFGMLALLLFLFQFVMYMPIIDSLFPERESINVTAVKPCSGEVKQRIFLNGHIDAAWEFPLNYRFGGIIFETPGVMAVAGVIYYIVLSIISILSSPAWSRTAGLIGLIFIPFFLLVARTYDPGQIVDGANDNLTGCYMGISVLREMERLGVVPENTEIGVILTGSEEAGLKGAKAWAEAHRNDYSDVPTCILCFDTIHDPKHLMVNRRDLNGTVRSDEAMAEAFLSAAAQEGVPCRSGKVPLMGGSTDSAAFTQGGFGSVGITGLNHVLEDYYHTRKDTYDNLDETGLENCYKATVRFIYNMDQSVSYTDNKQLQGE